MGPPKRPQREHQQQRVGVPAPRDVPLPGHHGTRHRVESRQRAGLAVGGQQHPGEAQRELNRAGLLHLRLWRHHL
eukprot:5087910-Pyramimonas_sp.AAC.1